MSIKTKLLIIFFAVALLPMLFVGFLTFSNYKKSLMRVHFDSINNIAAFKVDKIESYINALKSGIEVARNAYILKKYFPLMDRLASEPNNPDFLAAKKIIDGPFQVMEKGYGLNDIMWVNPQGEVVYSSNTLHYNTNRLKPLPDPEQKAFREGKKKIYLSDVFFNKDQGNKLGFLVTAPVFSDAGVFIGVVAFEVDMASINKLIQDKTGLGVSGEALIGKRIGNDAVYLNARRHNSGASLQEKMPIGGKLALPIQEAVQGRSGSGLSVDYRGKKVIAAWRYISSLDWGLVTKLDTREAFADINNLWTLIILIMVIVFILAGILAISVSRSISRPIKQLYTGAKILGSGNLDHKIMIDSQDEIGELSREFNKMTGSLKAITASRDELNKEITERKRAEEELRESKEDLNRAQEVAHTGSWQLDMKKNELTWSDENHRMFGIPKGTPMTYETFLSVIHPDDRDYVDKKWKASMTGEDYDIEHRIIVSGQVKWVREKAFLEFDEKGVLLVGFGITQDITERKLAQEELAREKENLQAIFEVVDVGMLLIDEEGVVKRVNNTIAKLIGKDFSSCSGSQPGNIVGCIHALSDPAGCGHTSYCASCVIRKTFESVLRTGEPVHDVEVEATLEINGKRQNLWLEISVDPLILDNQRHVIMAMNNISLRKQAEATLQEAKGALERLNEELEKRVFLRTQELSVERQRLYDVLEALPVYVVLLTEDYRVPFANKFFRERFGESGGKRCYEYLFKRTEACENCESYKVMKTNAPHHWEWLGPDGRNYDIYDFPFKDTDGSRMIMEMGIDVTDGKRAQYKLLQASAYNRSLIEASPDPLVTIGKKGKITDVNRATEFATGIGRSSLIGKDFSDYFTDPQKARSGYEQVFKEGTVRNYPLEIRHIDGHITPVIYNASLYRDDSGNVIGVFAAARDISNLRKAEDALLEAQKEMERAKRLSDIGTLAATVAHELRNPLGVIRTAAYNIRRKAQNPDIESNLANIEKKIHESDQIINNLLFYSRIKSPYYENLRISTLLNECIEAQKKRHENIRLEIKKDLDAIENEHIEADGLQMGELFNNILSNAFDACKDTKNGRIKLAAHKEKAGFISIAISDNGAGIDKESLERIFDPFFTTKAKGTGLGLTVCKQIVDLHGGFLSVTSEPGKGTTFVIDIPKERNSHA